jgi:hypothetical protein
MAAEQKQRTEIESKVLAAKRMLAAKLAQESLLKFTKFTMPDPDDIENPESSLYEDAPHHRLLADALERVERGECLRLCISIAPQHGKQLAHDTPILTPSGFVMHGDLRPGDFVYGSDGQPVMVVAVGEEAEQDVEIEFSDGEIIRCHERHEWNVRRNDTLARSVETIETLAMESDGVRIGRQGRGGRWRFCVDWVPVVGEDKVLPVEPYTLGAWLGDGSAGKPCITHAEIDAAIVATVANSYAVSSVSRHKDTGVLTTYFSGPRPNVSGALTKALQESGVYLDKHIPSQYFAASFEQRQRLLAGLMDTDGYIHHKSRRACFSTCNRRLAGDVATLVRTFGMRATVAEFSPHLSSSGIQGRKPVFQVKFSPSIDIPCSLERKRVAGFDIQYRTRGIVAIRRIEKTLGRCIQVANEDGIYLAGRGLIPTHNSELASRRFPAWAMGRKPWRNLMFGTYNQDFANEFGDDVRSIMTSPEFGQVFPHCGLRIGSKAKDHMVTTRRGKMSFLGRGGAGTGRPADIFVIDDPIKDAEEAASFAIRNKVWEWFTRVAYTRCHVGSAIIIIQTRWHEDDLIGRLTDPTNPCYSKEIADSWTYVNIPAILDDVRIAEALGRKLGDALWPERFPLPHLESARMLNPVAFSALYMGRPTPPEGAYFKLTDLHGYKRDELPARGAKYMAGDLALSVEIDRDHTVFGGALLDGDTLWILPDLYWEQKAADDTVEAMIDWVSEHGPLNSWWERGQIAKAVGPFLEKRMQERGVFTNMETLPSAASKGAKCLSIRGRMRQGKVRFPTFAPWWPRAKEQLLKFTGSGGDREDDFCDFLGLLGQGLADQFTISAPTTKPSNVIKVGTMRWVVQAHKLEQERAKRAAATRGW